MEEKKCACGRKLRWIGYYQAYECICGKAYNALLQELAPIDQWKDEYEEDY